MTRTVMCRKHKQQLPGLDRAPYPGAKGEDIFQNVSKRAWDEWQKHQTLLINAVSYTHLTLPTSDLV